MFLSSFHSLSHLFISHKIGPTCPLHPSPAHFELFQVFLIYYLNVQFQQCTKLCSKSNTSYFLMYVYIMWDSLRLCTSPTYVCMLYCSQVMIVYKYLHGGYSVRCCSLASENMRFSSLVWRRKKGKRNRYDRDKERERRMKVQNKLFLFEFQMHLPLMLVEWINNDDKPLGHHQQQ